jgi:hypothetical protein
MFAMQIVALSTISSVVNPAKWGISTPLCHIRNITVPEGYCLFCSGRLSFGWAGCGVLTNPEEVKECNQCQVCYRVQVGIPPVVSRYCGDGGDWYDQLGLGQGVFIPELLNYPHNWEVEGMLCWGGASWVGMSVQNELFGNVPESPLN